MTWLRAVGFSFFLMAAGIFASGGWVAEWIANAEGDGMLKLRMPGKSHRGALPPLTAEEARISARLAAHIQRIAGEIGERNMEKPEKMVQTAEYIRSELEALGYAAALQEFQAQGVTVANVEAERQGSAVPEEILVVGAHYDTVAGSPGANDNTTGIAALLELARLLKDAAPQRSLRFVAFANEEAPYFLTDAMGSVRYATRCKQRGEKISGMISLETMGYYSDEKNSQKYPFPLNLFYPDTGNFIGFVANPKSSGFLLKTAGLFRQHTRFPSEGGAVPESLPGIGWSDHAAFWREGYPALMITDSAPYRYPYYHSPQDTPDKVQTDRLARVVLGLSKALLEL